MRVGVAFMCWNSDWFDAYKACGEGFVRLANNVHYKVMRIARYIKS